VKNAWAMLYGTKTSRSQAPNFGRNGEKGKIFTS